MRVPGSLTPCHQKPRHPERAMLGSALMAAMCCRGISSESLKAQRRSAPLTLNLTIAYDVTHDSLSMSTCKALVKKLCSFQDIVGSCAFTQIFGQVSPAHLA